MSNVMTNHVFLTELVVEITEDMLYEIKSKLCVWLVITEVKN